jgi:hypothetical protein
MTRRRLAGLLLAVGLGTGTLAACHLGPIEPAFCSAANTADEVLELPPGSGVPFDEPGHCLGVAQPTVNTFTLPAEGTYKVTFRGDTASTTPPGGEVAVEVSDILTTLKAQVPTPGDPVVWKGTIEVTAGDTLRVVVSGTETLELDAGRSASIHILRIG